VDTVLGYLSAGDGMEDVLEGHPNLTRDDVLACLEFARRLSATHSVALAAA
jgi:hypothetical protein